jgi:serine/threonine protein kinase
MEYINGGDMFFHIRKAKYFSNERARYYAAEMVLAIEFMHLNGVIYRDLKPENVLIDNEGHIKIIDFGLSNFKELKLTSVSVDKNNRQSLASNRSSIFENNIFDDLSPLGKQRSVIGNNAPSKMISPNAARKLEAATICGTPEYIAPEVILGKKYNQSVDYYGLGLLIFEMLSGYNPYKV